MIEDIIAQSHTIVDSLNFDQGTVALAALRTIYDSPANAGPFARLMGMSFHEMNDGICRTSLDIKHHMLNPHGIAHGGVAFSLADSTCGGAAASKLGSPRIVTQDMLIRYHGPVRPGLLSAEARVVHHGQRTITTECKVSQNEILVASVTATFAILSDEELKTVAISN